MVIIDEDGREIYEESWDLTYNLKRYAPPTLTGTDWHSLIHLDIARPEGK
jgi:hypothetical protein